MHCRADPAVLYHLPCCPPPARLRPALQNANRLRVLPPSIGALTGMVRLSLHINQLEHLPPELGNLTQLEALRWGPGSRPLPAMHRPPAPGPPLLTLSAASAGCQAAKAAAAAVAAFPFGLLAGGGCPRLSRLGPLPSPPHALPSLLQPAQQRTAQHPPRAGQAHPVRAAQPVPEPAVQPAQGDWQPDGAAGGGGWWGMCFLLLSQAG